MNKITKEEKEALAKDFGLTLSLIDTVIEVESSGTGFDPKTGLIKIQFEPYWFRKYTQVRIENGVENQVQEWKAYNKAKAINPKAAILSTSWGLGQIMGFNYGYAGFEKPEDMVIAFEASERNQLKGMLNFIKANTAMYNALKGKVWEVFAYRYNGENYKDFHYDTKLEEAYKRHSK